ncbi:MAG: protein kinase [Candidatus Hydrogenedentes bacterium]|nr:protein kinase [Candidatus Hydrogenedentota bacterium]
MANGINFLFGRVAVDLQLVAGDVVDPILQHHRDTSEEEFARALVRADLLSELDSARIRAVVARLLESHDGDAASALAELEGRGGGEDTELHQMDTLAGPPAAWRTLSESVDLDSEDAAARYVDPVEHDRGGMGRILIVRDERMNRTIAMKELAPALGTGDATVPGGRDRQISAFDVQRFLREARITGSLEHPSIVPVYELGRRADGAHYYTMKLVRGQSLYHAIRECRHLGERLKLLPHVINLCQAIAYAHDKGIIHRDIKPSNVMVGAFGETVVIDWGLARVLNQEDPFAADLATFTEAQLAARPEDPRLTAAGVPVGTPHYMAPEQAEGRMNDVGPPSDVYSLGVVLYEVITGKTPFTGTTSRVVLQKVRTDTPPSVHTHEPDIPRALAAICSKAMARDPARRYASAGELADELTRFTTGALVQGYEYTTGELIRHYYRRNRALCNTAMTAAAVTLVVAIAAYINILEANHRERLQRVAAESARAEAEQSAYRASIQLAANYIESQAFDMAADLLLEQPAAQRNLEWGLLFEQCNQDYATNVDQEEDVDRLWAAPGGRLLTLSIQDELVVRARPDLNPLHRIPLTNVMGATAAVSPDGAWLAIGRVDGVLQLYDFQNYRLAQEFTLTGASFDSVVFSGDSTLLASGTSEGALLVWNCGSGALVRRIEAHDAACQVFGMSRSGNLAITSDRGGRTVLWDVTNGQAKQEFIGYGPSLSKDRERFALRSGRVIEVRELESGALLFESPELPAEPGQPVLSPAGRHVAALAEDGVLRVFDVATGRPVATVQDSSLSRILAFSPDSERIALAATPNEIRIYQTKDGVTVAALRGHSHWVRAGVFDEDGAMFYSCAGEAAVKAWQVPAPGGAAVGASPHRIVDLARSEALPLIGAGSSNGMARFLDASSLEPILTVASFEPNLGMELAISPAGDKAVATLGPKTARVLHLPDGAVLTQWTGSPGPIRALEYCRDGKVVAALGGDSSVYLWDSASGREVLRFDGHAERVLALAVMPEGAMIATGDRAGRILLWDSRSGSIQREIRTAGSPVAALVCSPDGELVAASLEGESAAIFAVKTPPDSLPLSASNVTLTSLGFGRDGKRLLGLARSGGFMMWDTESGQQIAAPSPSEDYRTASLLLDPDHNRILVGNQVDAISALPVFPKSISASDGVPAEVLNRYKRSRSQTTWDYSLHQQPIIAFTPAHVVEEAIQRLAKGGGNSDGEIYIERSTNPLARLGLLPGDSVTKLNGAPCANANVLMAGLHAFAGSTGDSLTLSLARAGAEINIEHWWTEVVSFARTIEVTRDRALTALTNTAKLLRSQQKFLSLYNQQLSNGLGAGLDGPDTLEGIWLPETDTLQETRDLAALGLGVGDCIATINGEGVTSYTRLLEGVERATGALEKGFTGEVRVRVIRDRFQILDLTWSIS